MKISAPSAASSALASLSPAGIGLSAVARTSSSRVGT
jgi:hypothetical protein